MLVPDMYNFLVVFTIYTSYYINRKPLKSSYDFFIDLITKKCINFFIINSKYEIVTHLSKM